ncbi:MAG: response regulator transcription factor [Gammaproteobacteria bacterium]
MENHQSGCLLLVDDDETFCDVLSRALEKRGYSVVSAHDIEGALTQAVDLIPTHAVVDLKMPGESGLELIPKLCELHPQILIVVLTGYASIATAVEAIKLGAVHYLTKPTNADQIVKAFQREAGDPDVRISDKPIPLNRVEWEHIQKVLTDCNGNITAAARTLGMYRRTLQRKLQKRPVHY